MRALRARQRPRVFPLDFDLHGRRQSGSHGNQITSGVPVIREQEQWKPGLSKALPVLPWKWDRQSESMKASKQRYEREACETIGGGQSTTAAHTAQDSERR